MPSICLYFQVHQPWRLRRYSFFDIGVSHVYEDEEANRNILNKVTDKCYLPTNNLIYSLIEEFGGDFRVAYSLTGTVLEQMERFRPDALESFQSLAKTGAVEILNETYYHSLSFLYSPREFRNQVELHREKIYELFGQWGTTFRNTELIYNNELARLAEEMGYEVILAEGADKVLGWRSPNFVYRPAGTTKIKLLLKNYRLSDDIAFRFSDHQWVEYPLLADKFASWLNQAAGKGQTINLFMDYETFGEHQWSETGIFEFLKALPREVMKHSDLFFQTPREVGQKNEPVATLEVEEPISWADTERDTSAWTGNAMQRDALRTLYSLEEAVKNRGDKSILEAWRRLQTSDHFYYMCTKWFADGDVHKYFNHYDSPYDACINFMNILVDLSHRLTVTEDNLIPSKGG